MAGEEERLSGPPSLDPAQWMPGNTRMDSRGRTGERWEAHEVTLRVPRAPRLFGLLEPGPIVLRISPHALHVGKARFTVDRIRDVDLRRGVITIILRDGARWRSPRLAPRRPLRLAQLLLAVVPDPEQLERDVETTARAAAELEPLRRRH